MKRVVGHILDIISKASEWIGKIGGYCSIGLLISMMFLEVIMRYVFNRPTKFTIEFALFFQILAVAAASAYVLKAGGHISIQFITDMFSEKVRNRVLSIASIVGMLFSGFMCLQLWRTASWNLKVNLVTQTLGIPIAPFQFALFAGFALMGLQFLVQSYKHYKMIK